MKKVYRTAIKLSWKQNINYKFNFIFELVCGYLPAIAMVFLWDSIYSDVSNIGRYTHSKMITYIILVRFINIIIAPSFFFDITDQIQSGEINNYTLKPMNYIIFWFYKTLGEKIPKLLFNIIPFSILLIIYRKNLEIQLNIYYIVLFVVSLIFSYILYYILYMIFAFIGFWLFDVSGWYYALSFVIEFLSGIIIPISIMPDIIQKILRYLPFKYLINFPIDTLIGVNSYSEAIISLAVQVLWILILSVLLNFVFNKGIKSFDARGG